MAFQIFSQVRLEEYLSFIPIDVDDLKVGLYIKLDYGWGAHPFLRNSFKIKSQKDIAIIRKHQLTKITYDPGRSDPAALKALACSSQSGNRVPPEKDVSPSHEEIEEADQALQVEKDKFREDQSSHQALIKDTEKAYKDAVSSNKAVMQMISLGNAEGVDLSNKMLGSLMDVMKHPAPSLTLVHAPSPENIAEEVSLHAMNVCALSLLLGDTLGLNQEDSRTLGQGAMFHNIGLHRVPPTVRRKKKESRSATERQLLEAYPYYGRQMVQGMPGVPQECLDIISQHRENLDGSGYPQGLKGTQIAFLPRVVRVVIEYDSLLNNGNGAGRLTPTQALTYLYTQMKALCQPDIIDAFIATVTVYPPGSLVRLTDDTIGLVVKTNKADRLQPWVMLHETIQESGDLVIVDLAQEQELSIKESLHPKDVNPEIMAQLHQSLGEIKGFFVSA